MSETIARNEAEYFAKDCIYGAKPACTCSCPFNFDVPKFIDYIQKGKFTLAYRHFQDQSVFPGIVSNLCSEPCRENCVRKDVDSVISLSMLEKACVEFTEKTEPKRFNLPARNKKIAIIGAGLCGLTCAQRLGAKSYDVTVYEKTDRIGGRLWGLLDPEIFLPEIELQLQNARVSFELNTEINSLDDITFDAAFIATGMAGDDFLLSEGTDSKSLSTARPGVFLGGSLLNTAPIGDIGQGIIAYHSIEKYLKVGGMGGIPETFIIDECRLEMDLSRVETADQIRPSHEGRFTREEAVQEAKRCLECNCTACSDCCEIFDHFKNWPCAMVRDAVASLHTKTSIKEQNATRTMNSCNLCGLCKEMCPKDIDMGKFFHDFRYFKSEDKMLPPAFHDFFIRDMHFSNNEAFFAQTAPGYQTASHVFFPGCQLGASDPRYVEKTYDWLLENISDTAIIQGCCGAPADWGADRALHEETIDMLRNEWDKMGKPKVIFACPTCKHQFEEFIPEAEGVSLYRILDEKGLTGNHRNSYEEACVFDPCSSRYDSTMQESVRNLAAKAGSRLTELFYSREKAQCCGWGGHTEEANPSLFKKVVNNRISSSQLPYITYCTNCKDTFLEKGKECMHILDIVHGLDNDRSGPPTLSQKRKNRLTVKRDLLKRIWGIEMKDTEEADETVSIYIPENVQQKMDILKILEEDVVKTIKTSETSGYRLYDQETDTYIVHLRIGIITYWVMYKKTGEMIKIANVYSHRMEIVETLDDWTDK